MSERWRSQIDVESGTALDLGRAVAQLEDQDLPQPDAIGHRVVHGGPDHGAPALVDDQACAASWPTSCPSPRCTSPRPWPDLDAARRAWPGRPQVACFDTAFHHTLAPEAFTLALPASARQAGIRRYGFHGLSYEYVVGQLADQHPGRTVIAHLGVGSQPVRGGRRPVGGHHDGLHPHRGSGHGHPTRATWTRAC